MWHDGSKYGCSCCAVACSVSTGLADANAQFAFGGPVAQTNGRRQLYGGVLSRLRLLMISRMAKPEEVRPDLLGMLAHALIHGCLSVSVDEE